MKILARRCVSPMTVGRVARSGMLLAAGGEKEEQQADGCCSHAAKVSPK
jgi:hypothetical protein